MRKYPKLTFIALTAVVFIITSIEQGLKGISVDQEAPLYSMELVKLLKHLTDLV